MAGAPVVTKTLTNGPFKDMFIRTRAEPGTSVKISNLSFDGTSVDDEESFGNCLEDCESRIIDYLWLCDFGDSFTLTGTITKTFNDPPPNGSRMAFQIKLGEVPEPCVHGDPHIKGWKAVKRESFHGECDMVLLHSDSFADGEGLDVHVRTTIDDSNSFSFVEAAAVQIGQHHFVIDRDGHMVLDGYQVDDDMLPLSFGEQGHHIITGPVKKTGKTKVVYLYRLELVNEKGHVLSYIEFKTHVKYMAVSVSGHPIHMSDTVGLLGHYESGERRLRNGDISPSALHHGHEWKVQDHEHQLFAPRESDRTPDGMCKMPNKDLGRRRLRQNHHLFAEASEVCEGMYPNDKELCVQDVLLSGDIETVYAWN